MAGRANHDEMGNQRVRWEQDCHVATGYNEPDSLRPEA
jgi:hypothetical protein